MIQNDMEVVEEETEMIVPMTKLQGRHKRVALSQMRQATKVDGHIRPPNFELCVDKIRFSNILSRPFILNETYNL